MAVQSVLAGDGEAYGVLVERHRGRLYALAFGLTGDAEEAADLVQEALIAAYKALGRLRDPALFGAWVATILRNKFYSLKRRRRIKTLSLDNLRESGYDPPAPEEETGFDPELVSAAGALAASLPEKYRVPLMLRYCEDCSYREIAKALGVKVSTVAMRLVYARRLLLKKARRAGLIGASREAGPKETTEERQEAVS